MAGGLSAGVAKRGETCGALTGAIMATGLLVGRERFEDKEQLEKSLVVAEQVYLRFREAVGHTVCAEIHKIRYGKTYRLFIPEEGAAFHNEGGHSRTGCPEVCGIAARIAADIILDIQQNSNCYPTIHS